MAKKALGKGLAALIPQKEKKQVVKKIEAETVVKKSEETISGSLTEIEIDKIAKNTYQPRTVFKEEPLNDLIASIKENGLLQPIVVKHTKGSHYELIAGERRLRACTALNLKTIPAIVRKVNKEQSLGLALIENIQRHNLNAIEEAKAYQKLSQEFTLTQEEIATKIGKTRSAITNSIRLLKLPESVQDLISAERISMGHARALLGLENPKTQEEAAALVVEKDLSVRETEELVRHTAKAKKAQKKEKPTDPLTAQMSNVQEVMQRILGTKVHILNKGSKGKIEISYYSLDDLHRICDILNVEDY